jgi:hypothetical protein
MADEPRDFAEAEPPTLDLAAYFKERQAVVDWETIEYEPSKDTHRRMLGAATAYRLLKSKKLAASTTGWSYRYLVELERKYAPFHELMEAVRDEIAGTVRSTLVDAALVGGSVPAMIHLDELMSAEDYRNAEGVAPPIIQIAVTTQPALSAPMLPSSDRLRALAEQGVQDIEVPFTIPGVTQPKPSWYAPTEADAGVDAVLDDDEPWEDEE